MKNRPRITGFGRALAAIFFLAAFAVIILAGPALTQSTDRNHPSPWTSYGINGVGDGQPHEYYYTFDAGPGMVTTHVQARARSLSTGVTAQLLDSAGNSLSIVGAIATSGADVREQGSINLAARQRVLLKITLDGNAGAYSIWIDGATPPGTAAAASTPVIGTPVTSTPVIGTPVTSTPVIGTPVTGGPGTGSWSSPYPWTSYGINGVGDGRPHEYYYAFDAGPGTLTVHVQGKARTFSTGVTADLYTATRDILGRAGVIATSAADVRSQSNVNVPARQRVVMKITTDENTGPYSVWIDGPIVR